VTASEAGAPITGFDPNTGCVIETAVRSTTAAEVDRICKRSAEAAQSFAHLGGTRRAKMLTALATALTSHAEDIVASANRETALGEERLRAELQRTCGQLEMFARATAQGDVFEAIIDTPDPNSDPIRTADLRRILVGLGPVAVFGASNFPLAFSVLGGDTASALAAGCPVVVKAHDAHAGLAQLIGQIAREVVGDGLLQLVYGFEAGQLLVQHRDIRAVSFTGSTAGGRALHDLAAARPDPIPFYGELGSLNPVVITPGAADENRDEIAAGFLGSVLLGGGQFCTKPGLLIVPAGHGFTDRLRDLGASLSQPALLTASIRSRFEASAAHQQTIAGVVPIIAFRPAHGPGFQVSPVLLSVRAPDLTDSMLDECFGPLSIVAEYASTEELMDLVRRMPGSLTATVHATPSDDSVLLAELVPTLSARVGRLVWGGWPTGVAVTWAMQHGGPWPASTSALHTSVGVTAIRRFLRPVAYQAMPDSLLPPELRDENANGLLRRVNGVLTHATIGTP
jgi:NADP-dependent aldehyde dehydrogenase